LATRQSPGRIGTDQEGLSSCDAIAIGRTVQFSLLEQAGLLLWHIGGRGPLFGLAFAITTQLIGIERQWIGLTIYGTKRPSIGNLPSRPTILSSKNELLELPSVCEEVANNIEDHLTGG
jgi:hypothetical protein